MGVKNANSSKLVKAADFPFGRHVPRESPYMTTLTFFEKGRRQAHMTVNVWALNANTAKTVKDTATSRLAGMFPA